MMLGLSSPTPARSRSSAGPARRPIARGRVAAVLQTGGLLKDLTVARDRRLTASLFAARRARSTRCSTAPGIADIADRRVGNCSGGQQQRLRFAIALLPDPDAAGPRRADHRHGRRGPPRLLGRDPRRRRAGPHRPVRHALPGGGRRVRRPDRAGPPRPRSSPTAPPPRSRRWPSGRTVPGHAARRRRRSPLLAACPASTTVEVRGDTVLLARRRLRRASPATCSPPTAARDLEITAHSLEDAFLALTADTDPSVSSTARRASSRGPSPGHRAARQRALGPRRPDRLPGADRGARDQGRRHQRPRSSAPPRCRRANLREPVPGRRRARLAPARRSGTAARRRRSRWPSRSAGCGPSPAPSSRSSPARRAPSRPSRRGSALRLAETVVQRRRPSVLSRVLGLGGSSSRMIRRISSKAACRKRLPVERRRPGQQLVQQHAQASRCRCGCRRPGPSSSACSGLMYSGVPIDLGEAGEQRLLGQRLAGRLGDAEVDHLGHRRRRRAASPGRSTA